MSVEEKKHLLELLNESHSAMRGTVEGVDMGMRIYTDTGWQIRDIIGHIAVWDRQVAKSIRAYKDGGEYSIPDFDEDGFNLQAASEAGEWSRQELLEEWEQAREDFRAAVLEVPLDKFPGDLLFPWGDERGSIAKLVRYMCEHDEEHRNDIVKAIQASK
jgi:hypothetical protein